MSKKARIINGLRGLVRMPFKQGVRSSNLRWSTRKRRSADRLFCCGLHDVELRTRSRYRRLPLQRRADRYYIKRLFARSAAKSRSSNLRWSTTSSRTAYRSRRLFIKSHRSFIPALLLSKSNPLHWASIWLGREAKNNILLNNAML